MVCFMNIWTKACLKTTSVITEYVLMWFMCFQHVSPSLFTEPNEISQYLPIKEAVCEKLLFPERIDLNPADSRESTPVE